MNTISEEMYKVGVLCSDRWHERYGFIVNVDGINFFATTQRDEIHRDGLFISFYGLFSGECIHNLKVGVYDVTYAERKIETRALILDVSSFLRKIINSNGRECFLSQEMEEAQKNVLKYGKRPKMVKQDIREKARR